MKNPWKVLKIQPTADLEEIKRAYRVQAQQYHPDKAKTPEKERKFTIRFVEIQKAYETAIEYAKRQSAASEEGMHTPPSPTRRQTRAPWQEWVKATFTLVVLAIGLLLFPMVVRYVMSFPETHPFPVALSILASICAGCFFGFFLFLFLMLYSAPLVILLDKFGFVRYSDKIGWALSVTLWVFVTFHIGIPELNARQIGNAVQWFVAFGFGPVFGLSVWVVDYIKFKKVKGQYLSIIGSD